MSSSPSPDAIVVGGGIGGAVLAHLLARKDWRVVVLERHQGPPRLTRPEVLWPRTVERLDTLLPAAARADWALPLEELRVEQGDRLMVGMTRREFTEAGVQPVSTDPSKTRRLLLDHAPFEVRYGVEVTDVLRESNDLPGLRCRVLADDGTADWHARWIVGDDGARSRVRAACGIGLDLHGFPFDLLVTAFAWPEEIPPAVARVRVRPPRLRARLALVGLVPLPGAQGIAILPARPGVETAEIGKALEEWTAHDPLVARCLGGAPRDAWTRVRPQWGHAERYGLGRIALIGDALHPVSPAGGQGANMAVADAVALADALLSGPAATVLERYEARRRPANTRSFRFTRRAVRFGRLPSWCLEGLLPFLPHVFVWAPGLIPLALRSASTAFLDDAPA